MAIVQISRITHRKGLSENLPQLAGAEFGWVIDERKLYIGNGTLAEGAPAVGNTEILTEYSDILGIAQTYTYEGTAEGVFPAVDTGPNANEPVSRSLQNKLDDFASVRDFGAVGDGSTDDTAAINRALNQLFCVETNALTRRSLFFPAGVYKVTDSINIPTYAKIYGEGSDSSVIKLTVSGDSAYGAYVARTADSLQQTGSNIGSNGATRPQNIIVQGMTFETTEVIDAFLVQDAQQVLFQDVNFKGPLARLDLGDASDDIAGVRFDSSATNINNQITFDHCKFSNMSYGINTDEQVQGVTVTNSKFDTLYQGVLLGTGTPVSGGPAGFRIVHNLFDDVAYQGIIIGNASASAVSNNMTGYNIFLDVATNFYGGDATAVAPVIDIQHDNNVSVGDMFERGESENLTFPRIDVNDKRVFGLDKGERYKFGTYVRNAGEIATISITAVDTTITTVNINRTEAFTMDYTFKDNDNATIRHGIFRVVAAEDPGDSTGSLAYQEDYTENNTTGLALAASQAGNVVSVTYTSTEAGSFTYSIKHLG